MQFLTNNFLVNLAQFDMLDGKTPLFLEESVLNYTL